MTTAVSPQTRLRASFSLVPESGLAFIQGGSGPGCVIVSSSAEMMASGPALIELRAVLDGGTEASPGPVLFAKGIEGIGSRAVTFLFPAVEPGKHQLDIQFRNAGEPGLVRVGHRMTMVQFGG